LATRFPRALGAQVFQAIGGFVNGRFGGSDNGVPHGLW